MTANIDMTDKQHRTVLELLRWHLPDTEIWAHGSRVRWNAQASSDLDLVAFAAPEQRRQVSDLRYAFEESNLPFRVDLFVWDETPERFRTNILKEYAVLQQKATSEPSAGTRWHNVVLGDVCEIVMGQSPPGSTYNEIGDGLPFFQGVRDFNYRHPTPRVFCSAPTRIAQAGDILFSVRAPIGRVNVADRKCATGRGLAIIRPHVSSDARYIEFALRNLESSWSVLETSGSVFGNATKRDLESLAVRWPTDSSQRSAIAHILGTLDDKIELNRRMNETLEGMARALFQSWFVDFEPVRAKMDGRWRRGQSLPSMPADCFALFPDRLVPSELGEIPAGWEVKQLEELTRKPQYGYTQSAKDEPVGPKFLRITDINKKPWIEWETVPHCEITEADFEKYRLHKGDILIARMADPGHGCMIEEDAQAVFASYLIRFRPLRQSYTRFLQYWLRSDTYWILVHERGAGTTRLSLNARVLREFPLVVPQNPILNAFGEQVSNLRSQVVQNTKESDALAAMLDVLLPTLMSDNTGAVSNS